MKKVKGVFLSDLHMPDNINLKPVFNYIKDFKPELIILGGDIIDAKGMHSSECLRADQINLAWYDRDINLLNMFLTQLEQIVPKARIIFLEGNHCERWVRIVKKFPKVFSKTVNVARDISRPNLTYIPYNTYKSTYKLGDTLFMHGQAYPDHHSKKYAKDYSPYKVIYGHLHHLQAYTDRKDAVYCKPNFALTAGCLCTKMPEWKKGAPNQWVNGFVSFVLDGKAVIPQIHIIEKGKFYVGNKEYK